MRILLVHNHYGSGAPSGENQVFELERGMLTRNGHKVETFERNSDRLREKGLLGEVAGALMTPWNPFAAHAMREMVARFRPDIVHVHNTFPMISPAIFPVARGAGRVLTLHNYRLVCPAAIPVRGGEVCTECIDSLSVRSALRHGCYRHSRAATVPLALNVAFNRWRGTWQNDVEAFIVLTKFQRDMLARAALPQSRLYVKPNFSPDVPTMVPWASRSDYAVFVGRLVAEKGVIELLRAWRLWGENAPELRIVGDGKLRARLQEMAFSLPVHFLGQVSNQEVKSQIAGARLLLLPSSGFETFGLVIVEAFSFGTPVAVSNVGPLPSIVRHGVSGVVFQAGNPESLLFEVRTAWEKEGNLENLSQGARREFEDKYTEDSNYSMLMNIYERALTVSRREGNNFERESSGIRS